MRFAVLDANAFALAIAISVWGCGDAAPPAYPDSGLQGRVHAQSRDSLDLAHAGVRRAEALISERKYDLAIAELENAVRAEKYCISAHYLLGWIRATCPDPRLRDGRKALRHARDAIAADRYYDAIGVKDKRARWTAPACLAAAYAELGKFDEAIQAQEDALKLVANVPVVDRGIEVRKVVELRLRAALELYRRGRPLRTYKTFLSKLSDEWANSVLKATDKEKIPELAE